MTHIHDVDGIVETVHHPADKVVYVKWHTFTGHDHLRPSLEAQMAQVACGAAGVVIVDVSEATGVPSEADQAWFGQVVFPAYKAAGLRALINVQPRSALTRLGAKRWSRTASGFGFDIIDCTDVQHAFDLARDYTARAA